MTAPCIVCLPAAESRISTRKWWCAFDLSIHHHRKVLSTCTKFDDLLLVKQSSKFVHYFQEMKAFNKKKSKSKRFQMSWYKLCFSFMLMDTVFIQLKILQSYYVMGLLLLSICNVLNSFHFPPFQQITNSVRQRIVIFKHDTYWICLWLYLSPQTKFGDLLCLHRFLLLFLFLLLLLLLLFFLSFFLSSAKSLSDTFLGYETSQFTGMLSTMSRCTDYFRNFQNGHRCHGKGQNAKKLKNTKMIIAGYSPNRNWSNLLGTTSTSSGTR